MGFLKDNIGDEELNNMICSILASNVYMDKSLFDNKGMKPCDTPKEIKFIPYKIIDNDNYVIPTSI